MSVCAQAGRRGKKERKCITRCETSFLFLMCSEEIRVLWRNPRKNDSSIRWEWLLLKLHKSENCLTPFCPMYFIHEKNNNFIPLLPVLPAMTQTRTRGWYEHCSSISHMLLFLFLWIIDVFAATSKSNRHQKSSATLLKSRWEESNSTDAKNFSISNIINR